MVIANITAIEKREVLKQKFVVHPAAVQRYNVNNFQHVRHENTKASKQARLLEDELAIKLERVINDIKTDKITELVEARFNYGQLVGDIIRSSVERVYRVGVEYVNEFTNLEGFLTDFDLNKIKEISTVLTEEFWISINKNIFTRNRLLLHSRNFEPREDVNVKGLVEIIASRASIMTLNLATINKSRQLAMKVDSINVNPKIAVMQKGRLEKPKMYFFSALKMKQFLFAAVNNFTFFSRLPSLANTTLLVQAWATELDDRVCTRYGCFDLHGQSWEVGDPNTVVPPLHPRCRCRLLLAERSFADVG